MAAEGYFCEGLQSEGKKFECDVERVSQGRVTRREHSVLQPKIGAVFLTTGRETVALDYKLLAC